MHARILSVLTLVLLFGAMGVGMSRCTPGTANAAAVSSLATQTISSDGIGQLRVDRTTLAEVFRNYGPGAVSIIGGDDVMAVELSHAGGGMVILFAPEPHTPAWDRLWALGMRQTHRLVVGSPDALQASHPLLAGMTVQSVSVRGDWNRGLTDGGTSIGDPMSGVAAAHGPANGMRPMLLAGDGPTDEGRPSIHPGLAFYPRAGGAFIAAKEIVAGDPIEGLSGHVAGQIGGSFGGETVGRIVAFGE
ncbi:MAG: hypothetical protein AB8G96_09000 [Phycisphaerales bacterium]